MARFITPETDQLQESTLGYEGYLDVLKNEDDMSMIPTKPSPQSQEELKASSNTKNSKSDPVDLASVATSGSSGDPSGHGSSSNLNSLQKQSKEETKAVNISMLLRTIDSQLELNNTFHKQLEIAKNQLELLQQIVRGVGGTDKEVKSAAAPKSTLKWDYAEGDNSDSREIDQDV